MKRKQKCQLWDCGRPARSMGFCQSHYERNKRHGNPYGGRTPNGEQRAWIDKHAGFNGQECLIWPYNTARGYGYSHIDGKYASVSRHMCIQRNGPPPTDKHESAHVCGNGHLGCVNPAHLEWKTSLENKVDQLRHGTRQRGEQRPMAKLTTDRVKEIRRRYAPGEITYEQLAQEYGVTREAIYSVVKKRTWAWLD
jgi:hypothetical protein